MSLKVKKKKLFHRVPGRPYSLIDPRRGKKGFMWTSELAHTTARTLESEGLMVFEKFKETLIE